MIEYFKFTTEMVHIRERDPIIALDYIMAKKWGLLIYFATQLVR